MKTLKTDLEVCFVKHILAAMKKRAPIGFLFILGIQCVIGSVFYFSAILKPKRFVYILCFHLLSHHNFPFAVSVISMSNNACLRQYHFNTIPFTYNSNIVGCFINRNKNNLFLECIKTAYDVNLF